MHTPVITVLAAALLAASAAAPAATPINESRPLDPRGRVEIENVKGRIEVRAWDRPEVRIEGALGKGVERLEIQGDRGVLRVKVKYPSRNGVMGFALGDSQSEPTILRLMVPVRADLDISAVSADVLAWGVAPARLEVENVSGRTTIAAAPDAAEISSVSGDLDLTLNRADLDVESVSGDVRLRGRLGGEIAVETVSGDVDIDVLGTPIEQLEGTSVSGDMRVRTAVAPRARMTFESVSGDIDLRLPRTVSADVRAESFSGNLSAPNAKVERPRHGPGANLRQRYGSGDAEISIETFSGDAELRFD